MTLWVNAARAQRLGAHFEIGRGAGGTAPEVARKVVKAHHRCPGPSCKRSSQAHVIGALVTEDYQAEIAQLVTCPGDAIRKSP
jgi:hypothetical protein